MSIDALLRLFRQNLLWMILLPVVTAATAWYVTRDSVKTYRSEATLYTGLASGYTLLTDRLGQSMDRSSNAFDNLLTTLNSKETRLQVGISLLTDHLRLQQPDTLVLGTAGFDQLHQAIPADWQPFLFCLKPRR
ncbi:MAG: lipopolysaccharide biosynthesis protein, partial [Cytophagaceae bacterium]